MFDQNPNSMLSVSFSFHALVTWIIFVNAFCPEILQTTQAKSWLAPTISHHPMLSSCCARRAPEPETLGAFGVLLQ